MTKLALATAIVFCAGLAPCTRAAGQACEQLGQLNLPNAKVTSARTVAAGTFTPPAGTSQQPGGETSFYKTLPAFCRVTIEDKPSADSDIKIEVWMPVSNWNGKFRGQGNGGFAGDISYRLLGIAILGGYASAATDTGHAAANTDATWALGHSEKIVDFGYRAIHEMTALGKTTTKAFYGDAPKHTYFAACSNGGRQALMEAQRYPDDYDGILAGAPANYWTHLLASALWDAQATTSDPASYIPASKITAITRAVNAACDAKDGVADGVLNDPRECHFEPKTLLCKSGDSADCLTQPQVTALEKLYQGARDSQGHQVFPGFMRGGEDAPGGWTLWITGDQPGKSLLFYFGDGYFRDMVYDDPNWDDKTANFDQAVAASDKKYAGVLNSNNTDMSAFKSHGGKLIVYHGWNDAAISALNSINYYEGVVKKMGPKNVDSFLELYMVPGMQHCAGGPGPDVFGQWGFSPVHDAQHDMYQALEEWVENGTVPNSIIASKLEGQSPTSPVVETRPLCPYPQVAKYKGTGDTNDASNFVCTAPAK